MLSPIPYSDALELIDADEAETIATLIETMQSITATTFADEGRALRGAHAKAHGVVEGEVEVLDLPPELAQGVFAAPGRYAAKLRLSTAPGDLLDDRVSTPRGMALKLLGVPGAQLSGNATDTSQDFVLVDGPAFFVGGPKAFAANVKPLAATTDRVEGLKRAFSVVARGLESVIEAVGGESGKLTALGGHALTNPLGETYYSQVPSRYGDYVAKFAVVPVSPALTALTDAPVDLGGHPDGLRDTVTEHFTTTGGEWEIRVQLCTDLDTMPIEDASVVWPEEESPYRTVARLRVAAQPSWSSDHVAAIDDGTAFSPWHGLVAHRPLGGIQRARRNVYAALQSERSTRSGCPFHQS